MGGTWARTNQPPALAAATYDAANQQVTFGNQTLAYDPNGNLTSDGVNTYTWNARNQLAAIAGPVLASFGYDGTGRRRTKTVGGMTTSFLYDGLNPLQEQSPTAVTNLLTGFGIDELFARADASGPQSYFADVLGSTVATTDAAGVPQAMYTYDAFGATTVAGTTTNLYDFTGRENDGTGLKYYRARYYHPQRQRFISEDPSGMITGINVYTYVLNSPLNWTDPMGLDVYIARYACCALAHHIGIGVDSYNTYGRFATVDNARVLTGVPAEVVPDRREHPEGPLNGEVIRIPTFRAQDLAIRRFIESSQRDPGTYRLTGRNCSRFVQEALAAGGIETQRTIFPNRLWDELVDRFGPAIPAPAHYFP